MKKIKLVDLVLSFLILYFASMCIHEYGHYLMLVALGGAGYIKGFTCYFTILPTYYFAKILVYAAGGLLVVMLYLLWNRIEEDLEDKIILVSVALLHLVYGVISEPLLFVFGNRIIGEVGSILGHLTMITYFMYMLYKNRGILQ